MSTMITALPDFGHSMTSREISNISGKRHSDIIRDIRNLLSKLNGSHSERMSALVKKSDDEEYHRSDRTQYKYLRKDTIEYLFDHAFDNGYSFKLSEYIDAKGEKRPEYILNKKDILLLISGYDVVLRSKIINRWEELEIQQIGFDVPKSYAEALMLAAKQAEIVEKNNRLLEAQRPKVIFADAVETSKTSILIGELAKILKQNGIEIGQNRLFEWLRENGYLISRKGTDYNMPTQRSMELDLFEIKETAISHSDGHVTVNKTPKVKGKGQTYFVNKFLNSQN